MNVGLWDEMIPEAIKHFVQGIVTSEEIRKIQAAIGKYDEFLALVKKRKLR